MNIKLIIIFLLISISTFANAQVELAEDYSFQKDKKWHTGTGAALSAVAFAITHQRTGDVNLSFRTGVFTASIAGLGYEVVGVVGGKEFSIGDLGYTFIGGFVTSGIMWGITKRRNKKQAKRDKLLRAFLADI